VLDGEIVVARSDGLDFEALQLRIHPAASRALMLSKEIPASIVFFDLLSEGDRDLRSTPFRERRAELETLLANAAPPLHVTPATTDIRAAIDWFRRFEGAGLDGVMAKPVSGAYEPNKRVMLKVKHERECDCVVAGFRWHKGGERTAIGSLLLGLYDGAGELQHVGVTASFTDAKRRELVEYLAPYRTDALASHPWKEWASHGEDANPTGQRRPGAMSRWSQGKDLSWEPLRPELVVEVAYDHMQDPLSTHRAISQMAHGQEAERMHLRPARGRFAAGARRDLCDRSLTAPVSSLCSTRSPFLAPFAGRVVVGVGFLLRRTNLVGHVAQIHADPRPGGRAPSHRIDEHVVDHEVLRDVGMSRLPSLEAGGAATLSSVNR
jgi:ATP-dependent DNA ligase